MPLTPEKSAEEVPAAGDFGPAPTGWEIVRLGDYYDFQNGVNADAKAYGQGVPFANVLEVITHSHMSVGDIPGLVTLPQDTIRIFQVRRGDILFNRTSETQEEVGLTSVYLDDAETVFGGFVIRGRPKNGSFDPMYAGYAFRSPFVRSQIIVKGQGAVRANIGQADLKTVFALKPPPKEQKAIAQALSDADALIESLESLIAKKRAIKQGAMQELLSGRRRLPGFSKRWETKKIGDVLSIMHGKSQHDVSTSDGPYPILATGGQIGTAKSYLYDKPSVLIGRKGTIDRPQYVETPFWTVDTLFYSVMNGNNSAKFFFYRFCLIDWRAHNEASGVPSLNSRTIEKIELNVPEPGEQMAIVRVLSDIDDDIDVMERRLSKARQIKQGMMQELLTGRVRLL